MPGVAFATTTVGTMPFPIDRLSGTAAPGACGQLSVPTTLSCACGFVLLGYAIARKLLRTDSDELEWVYRNLLETSVYQWRGHLKRSGGVCPWLCPCAPRFNPAVG